MNINKYLERIKYKGDLEPGFNVLKSLQRTHLLHIPFENLDIHYDVTIELSIDRIFEKIVNQGRGGFCYELNGLFFELLISLGFDAKRVAARVYSQEKGFGKQYDHLAIVVKINEVEYLTDVGFGDFTFEPLEINEGLVQYDQKGTFKIDNFENDYLQVSKIEEGSATPAYIFKNIARAFKEFQAMCTYHQTSSESHFTHKKMISIPTEDGRITLSGNSLKITTNGAEKSIEFPQEMFGEKLLDFFQIDESRIKK
ncbi:arylamine N-acetyltransferase family protein [Lutimonas sp.]|uniref:arylamine N-acetyltransferase family protein n=1 Tax=Lutimonas sp. TaxID=1872403 RepID=UPI003D9BC100